MRTAILAAATGLALLGATPHAAAEPVAYRFDTDHTEISFYWNHVGISRQHAHFDELDGTIVIDEETPANSKLELTIPAASISSGVPKFDEHLKSADFFEVEKYGEITFVSREIVKTGPESGRIVGDLTIKGITKPVTLHVTRTFKGEHPLSGMNPAFEDAFYQGFEAEARVLRSDWGLDMYAPLVSDWVEIEIVSELRRKE